MKREDILKQIHAQINVNGHIIGASVGSGMTAKYVCEGGADILLALSAGKYRIMGRSSHACYLCYGNNNDQVMEMGQREILPVKECVRTVASPSLCTRLPIFNIFNDSLSLWFYMPFTFLRMRLIVKVSLLFS